ncbi:hypothetical protein RRF57_006130 [Xylaria bambusicola]|uniref:Uncharacterized protein n=1 Tax=Xylaria bambusicola TaxID=326684 RepID=A0AAN7UDS7_9PEZI
MAAYPFAISSILGRSAAIPSYASNCAARETLFTFSTRPAKNGESFSFASRYSDKNVARASLSVKAMCHSGIRSNPVGSSTSSTSAPWLLRSCTALSKAILVPGPAFGHTTVFATPNFAPFTANSFIAVSSSSRSNRSVMSSRSSTHRAKNPIVSKIGE